MMNQSFTPAVSCLLIPLDQNNRITPPPDHTNSSLPDPTRAHCRRPAQAAAPLRKFARHSNCRRLSRIWRYRLHTPDSLLETWRRSM